MTQATAEEEKKKWPNWFGVASDAQRDGKDVVQEHANMNMMTMMMKMKSDDNVKCDTNELNIPFVIDDPSAMIHWILFNLIRGDK